MPVGRDWNQVGVWPAENSDAISDATSFEFVRASARRDEGRAVARTERTSSLYTKLAEVVCDQARRNVRVQTASSGS